MKATKSTTTTVLFALINMSLGLTARDSLIHSMILRFRLKFRRLKPNIRTKQSSSAWIAWTIQKDCPKSCRASESSSINTLNGVKRLCQYGSPFPVAKMSRNTRI